ELSGRAKAREKDLKLFDRPLRIAAMCTLIGVVHLILGRIFREDTTLGGPFEEGHPRIPLPRAIRPLKVDEKCVCEHRGIADEPIADRPADGRAVVCLLALE